MSAVQLQSVVKKYSNLEVIHNLDLSIEKSEFCVFVGPSGCGKSTLLRMIAGLETTTDGKISIGSRDVTHLDPAERGIAMVFQTYALYPHMTVEENMGFGLKMNGVDKEEIKTLVDKAAKVLQLGPYLKRKPKALSGGQRQRVAIGRAIVRGPEVFLFDEPLSNLDAELRLEMRVELARLHQELGATMVYVTHDQVEAMTLADKIVVLRGGNIEQVGSPMELYEDPDNKFVAGFIGAPGMNFLDGIVERQGVKIPALNDRVIPTNIKLPDIGQAITVGVRCQDISIDKKEGKHMVDLTENLGGNSYVYINCPTEEKLVVEADGKSDLRPGTACDIHFADSAMFLFDKKTEKRLR